MKESEKNKKQVFDKAVSLIQKVNLGKELLLSYLNYMYTNSMSLDSYVYDFIEDFHNSLEIDKESQEDIEWNDFFKGKFDIQYIYYIDNVRNQAKSSMLKYLKEFYKFLIKEMKFDVFRMDEGINLNFLERRDFTKIYPEGYRIVYFNKFDMISENDKWLIDPNGYEETSTSIQYGQLISLDFTSLKNIKFKDDLKNWVMAYEDSLKPLKTYFSNIIQFLNLLESEDLRNFKGNIIRIHSNMNDGDISVNQILLYIQYIKSDNFTYSKSTINNKIWTISSFLSYLKTRGYKISNDVFSYLKARNTGRGKNKTENTSRKIIEKEDYAKIYKEIKLRAENNELYKLMWSFMYLLGHTKMRNNEILGLKRDCIIPSMKKGEEVVRYISKTTRGIKVKEEPLSSNAIRIIKKTIELTNNLAEETDDEELSSYIFIRKNNMGSICLADNDLFYRKFKEIVALDAIEGGPYTLYDCRHTYMTNLFEDSLEKGEVWKAVLATGHSDKVTTLKNYVKPRVKSYLEALYKVSIGNVDIKGQVINKIEDAFDEVPENLNKIKVKRNCGYCKGTCNENNSIDCLLCVDFVATVDRIPYFRESIKNIEEAIANESLTHEKEHLMSIKKLYVAYLGKLLSLVDNQ